ncbi:hypothetical protein AX774_g4250 [Zancudomyces culisetae]|uniref:BZIP domain-containing protein n=1 Tax=Zancudomyces culisetae TaxID=1213189 RepID=A0A1R1PMU8_ZANCU|nr:hypothetical protein AX774_g4250 [Zancudomyces culisetae]|eukprot:OMH82274.1 hypothetical protein AX774_g4250 [Zancudomyces culisetae]
MDSILSSYGIGLTSGTALPQVQKAGEELKAENEDNISIVDRKRKVEELDLSTGDESPGTTSGLSDGSSRKLRSGRPVKKGGPIDEIESLNRKKARTLRNRLAAQRSREKKKVLTKSLEEENKYLVEENQRLADLYQKSEARRMELEKCMKNIMGLVSGTKAESLGAGILKDDISGGYNSSCLTDTESEKTFVGLIRDSHMLAPYSVERPSSVCSSSLRSSSLADSESSTYSYINGDLCESAVLAQLSTQFSAAEVSVLNDFLLKELYKGHLQSKLEVDGLSGIGGEVAQPLVPAKHVSDSGIDWDFINSCVTNGVSLETNTCVQKDLYPLLPQVGALEPVSENELLELINATGGVPDLGPTFNSESGAASLQDLTPLFNF